MLDNNIYNALVREQGFRGIRQHIPDEWERMERLCVLEEATKFAEIHDLPLPTLRDVELAERLAIGHVDYTQKWVRSIIDIMKQKGKPSNVAFKTNISAKT